MWRWEATGTWVVIAMSKQVLLGNASLAGHIIAEGMEDGRMESKLKVEIERHDDQGLVLLNFCFPLSSICALFIPQCLMQDPCVTTQQPPANRESN